MHDCFLAKCVFNFIFMLLFACNIYIQTRLPILVFCQIIYHGPVVFTLLIYACIPIYIFAKLPRLVNFSIYILTYHLVLYIFQQDKTGS